MWESKSKHDLIIEVWEKLDCENIGRAEIEAIEVVIREQYGESPIDTPMRLARLLADEGAELRHAELLELDVERRTDSASLPVVSRPLDFKDLASALESIDDLEKSLKRFENDGHKNGIRELRKKAKDARDEAAAISKNPNKSAPDQRNAAEVAECLSIWIQSPEIFRAWITARAPKRKRQNETLI